MNDVIYKPRGKALEYAPFACNLFTGCIHRCRYCYCPAIMRQSLDDWADNAAPKKNIIQRLDQQASKMVGFDTEVLFSFMADPYQSDEAADITRQALLICERYQFKQVTVLTKGGERAMKDFDILSRNNWKFGSTIIFSNDALRNNWEPGAAPIESRVNAIKQAHAKGITTWVSVEPVIDLVSALRIIHQLKPYVDFWKVGKLNHHPDIEKQINWREFLHEVKKELEGCQYYIKKDLRIYD